MHWLPAFVIPFLRLIKALPCPDTSNILDISKCGFNPRFMNAGPAQPAESSSSESESKAEI